MKGEQVKNLALGAVSTAAGAIVHALGGWNGALQALVAFMVADYVTGVLVAAVWKKSDKSSSGALNSRAGFQGLCRKGVILLVVWVAQLLDQASQTGFARTAVCFFFTGNEGLSLLENLGLMGLPYPAFFKRTLEALREKGDEENGTAA